MEKSTHDITRETGLNNGMINTWIKKYKVDGMNGLISKKKPGNPMCKYSNKKFASKKEKDFYSKANSALDSIRRLFLENLKHI